MGAGLARDPVVLGVEREVRVPGSGAASQPLVVGDAALGAAALAAVGVGLWSNFDMIDQIHQQVEMVEPNRENNSKYEKLIPVFAKATEFQARISEALHDVEL